MTSTIFQIIFLIKKRFGDRLVERCFSLNRLELLFDAQSHMELWNFQMFYPHSKFLLLSRRFNLIAAQRLSFFLRKTNYRALFLGAVGFRGISLKTRFATRENEKEKMIKQ